MRQIRSFVRKATGYIPPESVSTAWLNRELAVKSRVKSITAFASTVTLELYGAHELAHHDYPASASAVVAGAALLGAGIELADQHRQHTARGAAIDAEYAAATSGQH